MKSIREYIKSQNIAKNVEKSSKLETNIVNNITIDSKQIGDQNFNDIFIIDAMNLFIRNFSISTILDKRGNHIGGLVGSLNSVYSIIRNYRPKKIIIVFEGDNSTVRRKKLYKEYKANRKGKGVSNKAVFFNDDEAEESFNWQLFTFIQYLQNLPINLLSIEDYEADDVIGWIATKSSLKSKNITIISADQDYLQLVNSNIKVFSPIKKIFYSTDEVFNEFGIHSYNFLLYKSLIGDKSDNILGVKGLQLKTLLKIFPKISENVQIYLNDLYKHCETKVLEKKPYKIYQEIINSQDLMELNEQLMDLSNIPIPRIVAEEIEEILTEEFEPNLIECVYNSSKHCMDEHLFKSSQAFFSEFLYLT